MIEAEELFYGIKLDVVDPFLERNLARLEMRFEERYLASLEKEARRKEAGKPAHLTILRSIEENKERLEVTQELRRHLGVCSNGSLG